MDLFDVLDLFSYLFGFTLCINNKGSNCGICDFGTGRVDFTVDFLKKKIKLSADLILVIFATVREN